MSHATPAELHDHVYGFRASAHVADCAECRRAAEAVEAERAALRDALAPGADEPAPDALFVRLAVQKRRRPSPIASSPLSAAGLVAAVLFLGALGWLLFHRSAGPATPADAGRTESPDAIDRLLAELRSPDAARRELAAFAISAYGQAAAPKVQKAKVDPALFPGVRWTVQDPKVLELLRTKKLDLSFENAPAGDLLKAVGEMLRLTIEVDPKGDPRWDPAKTITFKTKDLTAENCLKLFGSQFGLNVFAEEGKVILSPSRHPGQARAPIRVGNRGVSAGAFLRALESPSEDERLRAERELERLNFAAESELWAALDSPFADARRRIARLIRRLYDEKEAWTPPSSSLAVKAALREKRITCDYDHAPLMSVVDYWREMNKLQIHLVGVADSDLSVSFKGEDLTLFEALTLALAPLGLGFEVRDAVVVISPADQIPAPRPGAPLWTGAAEAARVEALLAGLASRDPAGRRQAEQALFDLGEWALAPLDEVARLLDPPLASQARALRGRIFEERKLWLLDAGSGARIQALNDDQRRILEGRATFALASTSRSHVLRTVAQAQGKRLDLRTDPPGTIGLAVRDVPFESLLRALTLPHGLDYRLDGETIVVDTAARVREDVQ